MAFYGGFGMPISGMPIGGMPTIGTTVLALPLSQPAYARLRLALQGERLALPRASARPLETEAIHDASARLLCVPTPLSSCLEYIGLSLARPTRLTLDPLPR